MDFASIVDLNLNAMSNGRLIRSSSESESENLFSPTGFDCAIYFYLSDATDYCS